MRRADLVPDCGSCAAVCCVAPSFEASDDFAFDKPAGIRCPNLTRDDHCRVYAERAARGCSGCVGYDCYGAGQRVTRAFAAAPHAQLERNEAFLILRVLHELLWLLTEAAKRCPPSHPALAADLAREIDALDRLAHAVPGLLAFDPQPHRELTHALLRRVGSALGGRRNSRALAVLD